MPPILIELIVFLGRVLVLIWRAVRAPIRAIWGFILYPVILDRLFPWFSDNVLGDGWRPESAREFKQCHIALNHDRRSPNMCLTSECMAWKWTSPKVAPKPWKLNHRIWLKRRGRCNHGMLK
jgi:hypothetical protein